MRKLKVGMVQQHCTADIPGNIARLQEGIRACAAKGAELVVLQELHNSLYFCQEENAKLCDLAEPIPGPSTESFGALARELGIVLVLSLFERRTPGIYHNTAGDLGFQPIKTSVGTLGVLVCWDQWYPEAARAMALGGAEMLIYPTAIGGVPTDPDWEQAQQRQAWQLVQRGHSVANGLPVITVNRTGVEPDPTGHSTGIDFWGHSFATGAQGELLTEFEKNEEGVRVVELDMEQSEYVRRGWPFLRDRRIDAYDVLLKRFGK